MKTKIAAGSLFALTVLAGVGVTVPREDAHVTSPPLTEQYDAAFESLKTAGEEK